MRRFLLIFVLIGTLALTAAAYFIPEAYESVSEPKAVVTKPVQFHALASSDNKEVTDRQTQQFVPLQTEPERVTAQAQDVEQDHDPKPAAPEPPVEPTPELQYIGQMTDSHGVKKVFLTHDENTFVAQVGDVVEERWKVSAIEDHQIKVFDMTNQQSLVLSI